MILITIILCSNDMLLNLLILVSSLAVCVPVRRAHAFVRHVRPAPAQYLRVSEARHSITDIGISTSGFRHRARNRARNRASNILYLSTRLHNHHVRIFTAEA